MAVKLKALEAKLRQQYSNYDLGYDAWHNGAMANFLPGVFVWLDEFETAFQADLENTDYLGAIRFPVSNHPDEYIDESSGDCLLGPVARQIKERIDAQALADKKQQPAIIFDEERSCSEPKNINDQTEELKPTDKQSPAFVFDEKLPF